MEKRSKNTINLIGKRCWMEIGVATGGKDANENKL